MPIGGFGNSGAEFLDTSTGKCPVMNYDVDCID
jgi:hypothetical protein